MIVLKQNYNIEGIQKNKKKHAYIHVYIQTNIHTGHNLSTISQTISLYINAREPAVPLLIAIFAHMRRRLRNISVIRVSRIIRVPNAIRVVRVLELVVIRVMSCVNGVQFGTYTASHALKTASARIDQGKLR
jgi:hypothetical protein